MKKYKIWLWIVSFMFPLCAIAQTDSTHSIKVVKPENIDPASKGTLQIMKPDTTKVEKMDPSKDTIDQKKIDNMDPKNKNTIKRNSL